MRKLFIFAGTAVVATSLSALLAPAAQASTPDNSSDGSIKICKKVDGHDKHEKFEFRIEGYHYDKKVRVKSGQCKEFDVDKGWYKVTEYEKDYWKLKDIRGDYEEKDVDYRWAKVFVKKHETDDLYFYNKYSH
jgi:hypothetical protein